MDIALEFMRQFGLDRSRVAGMACRYGLEGLEANCGLPVGACEICLPLWA